ncbi:MAG: fasciclin domain-containing protein [Pseudobacteriovorax sp.]|nr:fasciclin domain-containing protein [Pseudobacteriovorax sp.]
MKIKMLSAILAAGVLLVGCGDDDSDDPAPPAPQPTEPPVTEVGLVQTIQDAQQFSILRDLVIDAGLAETLAGGDFTVFAPTNEAFGKLSPETLAELQGDKDKLAMVLTYHVVAGKLLAAEVLGLDTITTVEGREIDVNLRDGEPYINDSKILSTNITATNGVIHTIDSVLMPKESILNLAGGSEDFSTLVSLIKDAGLEEALAGDGPFTVFAPTNAAFAALPAATLDAVKNDTELLKSILLYHVAPGKLLAADVVGLETIATASEQSLSVSLKDSDAFINDSKIIATDLVGSNGVIHVIDSVLLPASAEEPEPAPELVNIVETAKAAGAFGTLLTALEAAELKDLLKSEGPFTVLAPNDDAFAKLPAADLEAILTDKEKLTNILKYHVIAGQKVKKETVITLTEATMANGDSVTITKTDDGVKINNSNVIATDILATNGVIHVIDSVLLPPAVEEPEPEPELLDIVETAKAAGMFGTLLTALEAAELKELLMSEGPFTVLAPKDEAFAKIPAADLDAILADKEKLKNILKYHVIAGQKVKKETVITLTEATMANGDNVTITVTDDGVKINDSNVVATDILATNGVIHVIDSVLLPPAGEEPEPGPELVNIVETAKAAGAFGTLLTALEAAELKDLLKSEGPFTVLAPNDDAFAKIPAADLEAILADKEKLTNILKYHVIAGQKVKKETVITLTEATMANGDNVSISVTDDGVMINDSNVIATDILATNGVIHVIDSVLLPPVGEEPEPDPALLDIVETAKAAGMFGTLLAALEVAELKELLMSEGPFTVLAPSDDAFAKIPAADLEAILADKEKLKNILKYHVIAGQKVKAETVVTLSEATMANGDTVAISVSEGTVMINDSVVTMTDVIATNGVIHVIDTVLLPPTSEEPEPELLDIVETAKAAGVFGTLLAALEAAELKALLMSEGPFTVLAPSDDAFAKIPAADLEAIIADKEKLKNILKYHVIAGQKVKAETVVTLSEATMANGDTVAITVSEGNVMINNAMVTATDILATNGVIHVIDTVLLPPVSEDPVPELPNIIETAKAAGAFGTLLAALEAAELKELLMSEGPFTVLAPSDQAFAKIPAADLQAILADKEKLKDILKYHVIVGEKVKAETVVTLTEATMANGKTVSINASENGVMINDSMVTATDIVASNGVIHIIDTVLIPQ